MSTQAAVETLEFDLRMMTSGSRSLLVSFLPPTPVLTAVLAFVQMTGSTKGAPMCFTSVSP